MAISENQGGMLVRTYAGVLDDVMIRYGKGREFLSPEFFNKMILKNVIFGSGLFLNDGYLVNHPLARTYLADPDSLLSHMISTGFIRIMSREPDADGLIKMPDRMADAGNASFVQLVRGRDSNWDDVRDAYRRMATAVFHAGTVRSWPAYDMSMGFCRLMDRVFESRAVDLGLSLIDQDGLIRIEEAFRAMNPERGNARDSLEKSAQTVIRELGGGRDDYDARMAEIMEIGNQAYHYNFGLTLNAEEDAPVAADTTVGMAFNELLRTRRIERAQLDAVPLIRFPADLPFDNGELFLPFIRAEHPLSDAKRAYMGALNRLMAEEARDIAGLAVDARAATAEYIAEIRKHFERQFGRAAAEEFSQQGGAEAGFGLSADDRTVATAGPTAHISVALQRAAQRSRRFLLERFELTDVTSAYDAPGEDEPVITIGDIRSQLSSIAFDEDAAKKFVEGLPPFGG